MKAYDITKLTAKLKRSYYVRYRNKMYCFIRCFRGHDYRSGVDYLIFVRAWFPKTTSTHVPSRNSGGSVDT